MNIFLIVDDYLPDSTKVTPKMMHELACEFIKHGHCVSVITPNSEIKLNSDILEIDFVTVYRYKSGKLKGVSKTKRAISEMLLPYHAWRGLGSTLKDKKCDLIIYVSPSIFLAPLVYKMKSLWGADSYLILRDFFPQWMIDSGILRRHSLVTYYFRLFEKINYAVADVIGVMSPMNLKWFKINFKLDKNIEVLYNWSSATPVEKCIHSKYRKALGLQGKVVYFYGGNLGYAQDMLNLVRLAKNMEEISEAHFVFVGSGDEFKLVQKSIKNLSLTNVSLLPSVSQLEYKKMLTEFDIGLFTLHKNHKTHNFPGKILGYMESELPILGSVNPGNDLKDIIEKNEAGCILTNGDDVALVDAAKKFLNKEYRSYIGKNARNLLKNEFSVSVAATKILSLVQHG